MAFTKLSKNLVSYIPNFFIKAIYFGVNKNTVLPTAYFF